MKHPKHANTLLASLPADVCARLGEDLQRVDLQPGQVLYESNQPQHTMYFPRSGTVSMLYVLENGESGEIAMVGKEGLIGVALLVDSQSTPSRAVVQTTGTALSLNSSAVEREFRKGDAFQFAILRFSQALTMQMAQISICSRHHVVDMQLPRWLLLAFDRTDGGELKMTQDQIATLLGVRREGITQAASKLQAAGAIGYSRGTIQLLDRPLLESKSCACYRAIRDEYARLLS